MVKTTKSAIVRTAGKIFKNKKVSVVGCGGMWQEWWHAVGACGRGCGYVVGGQAYGIDGDMW